MIELEFFNANESVKKSKCTLHKTGKFGFSKGAEELMELERFQFVKIGFDKAEPDKAKMLFMLLLNQYTEGAFKISKAGDYYYTNVKSLFDSLGIDYRTSNSTYIYDIVEFDNEGTKLFKLIRRIKEKRNKS